MVSAVTYLDMPRIMVQSASPMLVRAHVYVTGRVQGVFFRAETENHATLHNITGWVRNLYDGRVEAIFEGEKQQVDAMIEFCRRGPPGAHVSNLDINWEDWTGEFREFRVRHGT